MSDELKPQASVDTPAFRQLVHRYLNCGANYSDLIAHIDAWRVPDGYKLVPIEPTPRMGDAGRRILEPSGCECDAELCWSAMIAAAPTPKEDA
jgi:hypothetical protein